MYANKQRTKVFERGSENGAFTISLCANTDCFGPPGGYAAHIFNKNTGKPSQFCHLKSTPLLQPSSLRPQQVPRRDLLPAAQSLRTYDHTVSKTMRALAPENASNDHVHSEWLDYRHEVHPSA